MTEYKLTRGSVVLRAKDNASIPDDEDNLDWQEYQGWLTAGNTPDPADPAPTPPAPENTPLTAEDVERLLLAVPGVTRAKINSAKRDRGEPMP